MTKELVTAMLNGDAIQTRVEVGKPLHDGLNWEDENGFTVDIQSVKELSHVQRHGMARSSAGVSKSYVGKIINAYSQTGELAMDVGRGEVVTHRAGMLDRIPTVGEVVKIEYRGEAGKVTSRTKSTGVER